MTLHGPKAARRGPELQELGIIPDGALLIRDGVIEEVGTSRRIENLAEARKATEIDATGRVVVPGFVDSHTHLLFPAPGTGAGDEAHAAKAIRATTGQNLGARARIYLEAMARHGTTTVEAKTGCGPDENAELKILRVLSRLKRDPLDVVPTFLFRLPEEQDRTTRAAAEWVLAELLPKIRRRRLARFADVVWDAEPAHQEYFARYLAAARGLEFACKIHGDRLTSAAQLAGAVGHLVTSIDHLEQATAEQAVLLSGSAFMATLLPCASFHSGGSYAPARALIDAGVPVALASNFNSHHTPEFNMQIAIALACLRMRMTPAEAISAATINGAHALGCASRAGSLEPGKQADLLVLGVRDYRELGQHLGGNLVHMTMKRGECIYKEGGVAPRTVENLPPAW